MFSWIAPLLYSYIHTQYLCCSGTSTEEDSDIPEDSQPSAEEEEQLEKEKGKYELDALKSHLFNCKLNPCIVRM